MNNPYAKDRKILAPLLDDLGSAEKELEEAQKLIAELLDDISELDYRIERSADFIDGLIGYLWGVYGTGSAVSMPAIISDIEEIKERLGK